LPAPERLRQIREAAAAAGAVVLYAFGSRSDEVAAWLEGRRGRLDPGGSDVDLGVLPAPGAHWSVLEKVGLTQALEDLLGCGRVDLLVLPEADPFVAVEVVRGERLWAADPYAADEYELYVLRRGGDLLPLERERIRLILGEER